MKLGYEIRLSKKYGDTYTIYPSGCPGTIIWQSAKLKQEKGVLPKSVKKLAITLFGICEAGYVEIPTDDKYLVERMLTCGMLFPDRKIICRPGKARECHKNVERIIFKEDSIGLIPYRGFALDEHNYMWVHHSWLIDKNKDIVETTTPRSLYFGSFDPFYLSDRALEMLQKEKGR